MESYTIKVIKTFTNMENADALVEGLGVSKEIFSVTVDQCDPMAIMKAINQKPRKRRTAKVEK